MSLHKLCRNKNPLQKDVVESYLFVGVTVLLVFFRLDSCIVSDLTYRAFRHEI